MKYVTSSITKASQIDGKLAYEIFDAQEFWRKCTKEDFKGLEEKLEPYYYCLDSNDKRLELQTNPINGDTK